VVTVGRVNGEDAVEVPDHVLRSALDFAISVAAADSRHRPPLPIPAELRRFLRSPKLTGAALGVVRRAVDGDHDFRKHVASRATAELVDPVGMLWLDRPDGWQAAIVDLLPQADAESAMRREERRRAAAQEAALRARAEAQVATSQLERERSAHQAALTEIDRLRAEIEEMRKRLRESQRAEHAALQARAKMEGELTEVRLRVSEPAPVVEPGPAIDADALRRLVDRAASVAADLGTVLASARVALEPPAGENVADPRRRSRRVPLRLPGGVRADSPESAEFLLRAAGAQVLVDGYNVAKLGWPSLDLEHQRQQCILAAENLGKRWNLALTVVFDGAAVEGSHARSRRRVRIVYSPAGVSADDVLRHEVANAAPEQPVVVVTNDRAIVADVTADGANTVRSDLFLALAR
jgi:hypothetical protein